MVKKINLGKISKNGKAVFLAYDQGLEHGPTEFNDQNVDPKFIIDIAKKGKFSAMIFQKGIVEKYLNEIKKSKVPLIIKLNGKTSLVKGEPISRQLCSVKEAIKLGAVAVGYTIYAGSENENIMLSEFEKIEEEAHAKGLPVITWIYPRGKGLEGKDPGEIMAYAARIGLEIGADIVKLQYNGKVEDLTWAVKAAGKTGIVVSGGAKAEEEKFLKEVEDVAKAGAMGLAVGRNVWQHSKPEEISEKIRKIIFGK